MLPFSPTPVRCRPHRLVTSMISWFFIASIMIAQGQNLVNNGSFEQNSAIPLNGGSVPLTGTWTNAGGSPDYFHTLAPPASPVTLPNSWQAQLNPYHGQAVLGMYAYISNGLREYVRTQLNTPMQPGQMYRLTFAITRGNVTFSFALNAGDGFGALLSTYPPVSAGTSNIPAVPQWELTQLFTSPTWVKTTVDIWPDSAYEYLTFGNFNDNANTNVYPPGVPGSIYMFLDSVALVPVLEIVGDQVQCTGDTVTYYASPEGGSYSWTVNGLPAGTGDSIQFVMGNAAQISLVAPGTSRNLTVTAIPGPQPDLGADILLCDGDSATIGFVPDTDWSWTWSDGSQDSAYVAVTNGWVWLTVDSLGCPGGDSIFVDTLSSPVVNLGPDTILCAGDVLQLQLPPGDTLRWGTGNSQSILSVSGEGVYWGEVQNGCGTARDSIWIEGRDLPAIMLPADTAICEFDSLYLSVPVDPTATIVWDDQGTSWQRWVFPGRSYSLEGQNECGVFRDGLSIGELSIPQVTLPEDQILCQGDDLLLQAQSNISEIIWEDGSSSPNRVVTTEGLYVVVAANECGMDSDSLLVTAFPVPSVDLGGDTTICTGESVYLEVSQSLVDIQWEDGSSEPFREILETGSYSVSLKNHCGEAYDEKRIVVEEEPQVILPPDTLICEDQTLRLIHPPGLPNLSWPDGSSAESFLIGEAGEYVATAINTCGLFGDTIIVSTYDCDCFTFVPTAFSPNGDGENDHFLIGTICEALSFRITLYDRWGRVIISFEDTDFQWDGNGYPEGVYLWRMETKWVGLAGRIYESQRSGTLTLLR